MLPHASSVNSGTSRSRGRVMQPEESGLRLDSPIGDGWRTLDQVGRVLADPFPCLVHGLVDPRFVVADRDRGQRAVATVDQIPGLEPLYLARDRREPTLAIACPPPNLGGIAGAVLP